MAYLVRLAAFSLFFVQPVWAQTTPACQLCEPQPSAASSAAAVAAAPAKKALNIRIDGSLEFGVAAAMANGGSGMIAIDPRTELRVVSGGLIDLGGLSFSGTARLSGQPFQRVRITLPTAESLNASGGNKAVISGFVANVPLSTNLDANGELIFRFAGRFVVAPGEFGDFRGRVNISAEYE